MGDMIMGNKEVKQYMKWIKKESKIHGLPPPQFKYKGSGHIEVIVEGYLKIYLPSTPSSRGWRRNKDSEFKRVFSVI
tara:strand:+ start:1907 stop:2137 length:231 start_codon:yes stop_codon:yes gene_type:complete